MIGSLCGWNGEISPDFCGLGFLACWARVTTCRCYRVSLLSLPVTLSFIYFWNYHRLCLSISLTVFNVIHILGLTPVAIQWWKVWIPLSLFETFFKCVARLSLINSHLKHLWQPQKWCFCSLVVIKDSSNKNSVISSKKSGNPQYSD